jgi:hypothetical protein
MDNEIYLTAVSSTGRWSDLDNLAPNFVFISETVAGRTRIVKLRGQLAGTTDQRLRLDGGPWSEIAVHSVDANADAWIQSREAAAHAFHGTREGDQIMVISGPRVSAVATLIRASTLRPGDQIAHGAEELDKVARLSRLGRITTVHFMGEVSQPGLSIQSEDLVPLLSRDYSAKVSTTEVLQFGRGISTESALIT